jgi:hypothetical protein
MICSVNVDRSEEPGLKSPNVIKVSPADRGIVTRAPQETVTEESRNGDIGDRESHQFGAALLVGPSALSEPSHVGGITPGILQVAALVSRQHFGALGSKVDKAIDRLAEDHGPHPRDNSADHTPKETRHRAHRFRRAAEGRW